ncbi:DUF3156 family protein, partial [Klebsiella pneumoniae]|uniref:DUF3156 family protein n=1 Tax=Klebsiella pneumoniae TaxID=573 RepID=UPI003134C70C
MNAFQGALAGSTSDKLGERSRLRRLSVAIAVTFLLRQSRLLMACIHTCLFVAQGPVTRHARVNFGAHQFGWLKRLQIRLICNK